MGTASHSDLQTVVFVGPSCDPERIRQALPHAMIAPPVCRGDLYRFRLLNFSVFVILDGAFANALAVSPREVVDVLRDGAAVIGAASMGALRAADCAPAGALGYGRIYRLFRRRILSSEDEVVLSAFPEAPFSAISVSLVDIRFALRRACRSGALSAGKAEALVHVAESLPYPSRNWSTIAGLAQIELSSRQLSVLESQSAKHDDAAGCCIWTARQLRSGRIAAGPRLDRTQPLGSLFQERERGWDPLDGEEPHGILPAFADWLWASGCGCEVTDLDRLGALLESGDLSAIGAELALDTPSGEMEALLMRYAGYHRSVGISQDLHLSKTPRNTSLVRSEIVRMHKAGNWQDLVGRFKKGSLLVQKLESYLQGQTLVLALKRNVLFTGSGTSTTAVPTWKRSR